MWEAKGKAGVVSFYLLREVLETGYLIEYARDSVTASHSWADVPSPKQVCLPQRWTSGSGSTKIDSPAEGSRDVFHLHRLEGRCGEARLAKASFSPKAEKMPWSVFQLI